ncbi:TPA: pectin acetylesterase [Streptococcus suis]|nr:pectin acetylesterase [Streptococcus suis]HEM4642497.1 pectin acetylesterase [Streptococcus suis]
MKKVWKIVAAVTVVLALLGFIAYKKTFGWSAPELVDQTPQVNEWYRLSPKGVVDSQGNQAHGLLRIGKEKNKVMVSFFGGGVSINEETASGGTRYFATTTANQDYVAKWGIGSSQEGNPDTLLVTGFSAGGFATSLLADEVISQFPTAENVTVAVDSAFLRHDNWKSIAENVWKTPTSISDRLHSDNLVLDSLVALHKKRGDRVKILFDISYRDGILQQYQAYIDQGQLADATEASSDDFQIRLKQMVQELQTQIEGVGIYIWNYDQDKKTTATQHTTINFPTFFTPMSQDKSVADWLHDAVNGQVNSYGLELLD